MKLRVGLNGAGRIGRCLLRMLHDDPHVALVAVNDVAAPEMIAHLLRYDSVHGSFSGDVGVERRDGGEWLSLAGTPIAYSRAASPQESPWEDHGISVVVEATGRFTSASLAADHLREPVERVLITAVCPDADETIVLGAHDGAPAPTSRIVSTASCTTHAAALPLLLVDDWYGVVAGQMTTVHCTTGSQTPMDAPRTDPRRARSCMVSMIPTSTSAREGLRQALPRAADSLSCLAIRVPTATVSLVELVLSTSQDLPEAGALRARFLEAASGRLRGYLACEEQPLVSIDFRGNPHSATIDLPLVEVLSRRMLRIVAWYDNEWGYASRVADLLRLWAASGPGGPAGRQHVIRRSAR
jgi:glyceraldehyde 3-phosphate dehydrogenase